MIWSLILGIFTFVELNCENLFDCQHDSLKQDEAFMPSGLYHWTPSRYWKKINNIGKEIIACGELQDGSYRMPDLVALCEIENDSVMRDLTKRSILRNAGYEYIMTNSPDLRGIDVALMYSPLSFQPIESYPIRVQPLKDMRPTRDILYVKGRTAEDDTLNIFVVHAPSRSGGEFETRPHRALVIDRLMGSIDSLCHHQPSADIIIAGDFNDFSTDKNLQKLCQGSLTEASATAKGRNGALGTYKFHGEWNSLDHVFVSRGVLEQMVSCHIGDAEFLLTDDDEYGGKRPFRNINGVKWQNGFSDHLPLILHLDIREKH